jgi:transmembrane sensor
VLVGLIGAVAAGSVITILLLPGLFPTDGRSDSPRSYETQTGEQAHLQLQDGTSVFLGAQTALSATFTRGRRSVILGQGEALFEVAHDSARPFVVIAGNGSITAVGTTFDVRRDADRVVVTVTEGTVSVAPQAHSVTELGAPPTLHAGAAPHAPAQVTHGQRIAYDENGAVSAVEHTDAAAATAWREGYLQFYGEPLRYVVQAANRYSKRQIMVDTAAGDLLYTGNVVPTRIDAWVLGLERIFPVKTVEADNTHVLIQSIIQAPAP